MVGGKTVDRIYIDSAKKLRSALPKFVILLGAAFLIWMFGTTLLIPLGTGILMDNIETSKIINLIVIAAVSVLIFTSFREIRDIADSCAGYVTYYIGNEKNRIKKDRMEKLQRTFRGLAYVIFVSLVFLMFRSVLGQIHPALAGIMVIIITIWTIVSLYGMVMALGSEIEEATKVFVKETKKKLEKPRKRR